MNYSQEQLKQATLITNEQYNELENPQFEGQTRVDAHSYYKMYWSANGTLYYTVNRL